MPKVKQLKVIQFMFQTQFGSKKGISVIEILIAVTIIAVGLISLLGLAFFSLGTSNLIIQTTKANIIVQETMEIVRNFRDGTSWNNNGLGTLITGEANPYHPAKDTSISPPRWILIAGQETINSFTRKIIFTNVQRDGNNNIVESGGTNDPDTKKVKTTVSWQEKGRSHQLEITTYLTNWK